MAKTPAFGLPRFVASPARYAVRLLPAGVDATTAAAGCLCAPSEDHSVLNPITMRMAPPATTIIR